MPYNASDLLDQLMGPNRNLAPGERPKEILDWSDKSVCKFHLCGFCPYELFNNTKADLGNCPYIHEDALKQQYEKSDQYGLLGYEESFLNFITKILNDCERKIARGYERLKNRKPAFYDPADKERYESLQEQIQENLKKVEEMGSKGMVEEAAYAMQDVEDLKCELSMILQRSNTNAKLGYDREMEVCAVCGSLTLVNDLPSRFEDHLNGKQHMGYARIRYQVKYMNETQYWKRRSGKEESEEIEKKEDVKRKDHRHSGGSHDKRDHRDRKHYDNRRSYDDKRHSDERKYNEDRKHGDERKRRRSRSRSHSPRRDRRPRSPRRY